LHAGITKTRRGAHSSEQRDFDFESHNMFTPESFYTASEVCAALRISRQTLWRMERRGELTPRRLTGRTLRYLGSDLLILLAGGVQ
jgi:predicted DNA-binding transcriptional regulator AlpA